MNFTPDLVPELKPRIYAVCWLHFAIQGVKIPNRDPEIVAQEKRRREYEERRQAEIDFPSDDDQDLLNATANV